MSARNILGRLMLAVAGLAFFVMLSLFVGPLMAATAVALFMVVAVELALDDRNRP